MSVYRDRVIKEAIISPCGEYRYTLKRTWSYQAPALNILMLNPSTADDDVDDATIRRCIGFAKREEYGGILVMNLYALRTTNPFYLKKHAEPIGPENDEYLSTLSGTVLCAWGAFDVGTRAYEVYEILKPSIEKICLGRNQDGSPKHPLYVKRDQPFEGYP